MGWIEAMPFRIPKRKGREAGYTALDGHYIDGEKERLSDDDSRSDSSYSAPMLRRSSVGKPANAFSHALPPRRRFTRYFTLGIVTLLVVFALTLARLSWLSEQRIRLGLEKPPPKPATWEQFPFLKRYHGGIRTLVDRKNNKPEYPDPDNNSMPTDTQKDLKDETNPPQDDKGFQKRDFPQGSRFTPVQTSDVVECYLDEGRKTKVPQLLSYPGIPEGFPDPVMGSYSMFGMEDNVCFERFGRLGPYGLGYSKRWGGSGAGMDGDREGAEQIWGKQSEIDYREVNWGQAQTRCAQKNKDRFKAPPKGRNHFFQEMAMGGPQDEKREEKQVKKLLPKTAVVIRTWWDYQYDDEDLFYLRALVNELSLQSGTEYVVHFLIHVKDNDVPIWSDDATYQRVLNESLPAEFRGMGTLWSERQMALVYGGLPETFFRDLHIYGAYRSTYMPMTYFAHMHPEFDFFWHWEMDIRYTGHFYHLFDKVGKWADKQPRKGLWERNGRFYVPSEHGSWDDFKHMVRVQTEHGTGHKSGMYDKATPGHADTPSKPQTPVWGPLPPTGENDVIDLENDPKPPTSYEKDNYEWGVGEPADFITFNPLFDPHGTNWILAEDVTGYNTSAGFPPRRTAIITASRLSHRLLETMHRETAINRHSMFSEMWPGSCALHHGLKAVYAPHPVYIDRRWPTSYLAAIFNNGLHGASGGARTSVFSDERQHNFLGTTWYYHAGFPGNLWKRWLGYRVDGDGGELEEVNGEGRICLPGMLLHPVKQVDLVYEHREGE